MSEREERGREREPVDSRNETTTSFYRGEGKQKSKQGNTEKKEDRRTPCLSCFFTLC